MSDPLGLGHQPPTHRELLDGRVTNARLSHLAAGGAPDLDDPYELALAAWRDQVRDAPFPDYPQRVGRPVVGALVAVALGAAAAAVIGWIVGAALLALLP